MSSPPTAPNTTWAVPGPGGVTTETTRAIAAEALKAPLASPALTGTPTAPTQTPGDTSTSIATNTFTTTAVTAVTHPLRHPPHRVTRADRDPDRTDRRRVCGQHHKTRYHRVRASRRPSQPEPPARGRQSPHDLVAGTIRVKQLTEGNLCALDVNLVQTSDSATTTAYTAGSLPSAAYYPANPAICPVRGPGSRHQQVPAQHHRVIIPVWGPCPSSCHRSAPGWRASHPPPSSTQPTDLPDELVNHPDRSTKCGNTSPNSSPGSPRKTGSPPSSSKTNSTEVQPTHHEMDLQLDPPSKCGKHSPRT